MFGLGLGGLSERKYVNVMGTLWCASWVLEPVTLHFFFFLPKLSDVVDIGMDL